MICPQITQIAQNRESKSSGLSVTAKSLNSLSRVVAIGQETLFPLSLRNLCNLRIST